jgi:hypothetical protein
LKPGHNDHTYMFIPARWAGKGMLSIIGGPSEPITLEIIASQGGTGTITVHMELEFSQTERESGLETVYTLDRTGKDSYDLVQHHSKLGKLQGHAVVTKRSIILTFESDDGAYAGFEAAERIDENHYHLRGALSLNGMPSSVLEAAIRRLGSPN